MSPGSIPYSGLAAVAALAILVNDRPVNEEIIIATTRILQIHPFINSGPPLITIDFLDISMPHQTAKRSDEAP
jgi:hypothetical protein